MQMMNTKFKLQGIGFLLRIFLILSGLFFITYLVSGKEVFSREFLPADSVILVSTFDVDVTPPIGSNLAYDIEINRWDLGLRAKGIIIKADQLPIVLCAIDAIGIANEGTLMFKSAIAEAAGTIPERVEVHTLHQHDAPRFDPTAEKILLENGMNPANYQHISYDGRWGRNTIVKVSAAVRESLKHFSIINQIGIGEAYVHKVASNREVYKDKAGKVIRPRFSSTGKDTLLRNLPVGIVDSTVSLLSFWKDDNPVAILSFFATHPQSYYRTGVANPDFVGVARFFRQLAVPDALHIHFNGAGGNVAAGKYNDGSHINRLILARRLADGMDRAWASTRRYSIHSEDFVWRTKKIVLPPNENIIKTYNQFKRREIELTNTLAGDFAYLKLYEEGFKLEVSSLQIKNSYLLFLPGELFVEYQLAAKSIKPESSVMMASYGNYGTGYIGRADSYGNGSYETTKASRVDARAQPIIMKAIKYLLGAE